MPRAMKKTMTNFNFSTAKLQFATFSDVAVLAEKIVNINEAASVLSCRRVIKVYHLDGASGLDENVLNNKTDNRGYEKK